MSWQSLQRKVITSPSSQPISGASTGVRWQVPSQSTQVMESGTGTPQGATGDTGATIFALATAAGTVIPVRVISGSARNRRLVAPPGSATRPTPERVREAMFNALGSLGAVVEATVVDLFAGSGAMGIEALSRGAARVTFVDHDRAAREAIETNLAVTGLADRAVVVASTVERFLATTGVQRWDVALVDPPYRFDGWPELLLDLPAHLAVLESDQVVDPPFGWEVLRAKRYGSTHAVIAQRIVL